MALGVEPTEAGGGLAVARWGGGEAGTSGSFNPDSGGAVHGPGEHWGGSALGGEIFSLVSEHVKFEVPLRYSPQKKC